MKCIFDDVGSEVSGFFVILEPVRIQDEYRNVLVVSDYPRGPMLEFVHKMNVQPLTSSRSYYYGDRDDMFGGTCKLILSKYNARVNSKDGYLMERDLPQLYNYLTMNGYHIDYDLTKMTFKQHMNVGGLTGKPLFYCNYTL